MAIKIIQTISRKLIETSTFYHKVCIYSYVSRQNIRKHLIKLTLCRQLIK